MLKKSITYEDFNGDIQTEDFYFHLTKAELITLELSHEGGLSKTLERLIATKDGKVIMQEFKEIILGAYGKRSDDGRRFIKNQELRDEFESTEAYSTLFVELCTNTVAAVDFINGMIPSSLADDVAKITANKGDSEDKDEPRKLESVPKPDPEVRVVTRSELVEMSSEDMTQLSDEIRRGVARIAQENDFAS